MKAKTVFTNNSQTTRNAQIETYVMNCWERGLTVNPQVMHPHLGSNPLFAELCF